MPTDERRYRGPTAHAWVSTNSAMTPSSVTRLISVALHRERHGLRDPRRLRAPNQAPLTQRPDRREEQRDEEDADQGREEHPEKHAGADRVPAGGARAARGEQGRDAQDECERGH